MQFNISILLRSCCFSKLKLKCLFCPVFYFSLFQNIIDFWHFKLQCQLFEVCFQQYIARKVFMIQVNLCHELLFLHQLTLQYDCRLFIEFTSSSRLFIEFTSSIHENSKLKPGEDMLCTEIVSDINNNFCTQLVLPMFCKKQSFWQRFTCTVVFFLAGLSWAEIRFAV